MEYEGYFFAKSAKAAKMSVMLRNWVMRSSPPQPAFPTR